MHPIRLAVAALAVPLLLAATPAMADGRRDAEAACRDRIAADGRHDPRLDRTRYDPKGPGATLVGEVRSGKDDRHRFECTLDRKGRVRGISLTRIGGDRDRDHDRDHDRDRDRGRDRDNSRVHSELVGRGTGDAQGQLRAMGYEQTRGDHWFLGATGECIVVRNAGNRIADVRRAESRNCR